MLTLCEAVFLGTKHVLPLMQKAGRGSIVNVSSIYGIIGAPDAAAYEATKGAVRLLTKATAVDYAPFNIRANSIHPGVIRTHMTADLVADPDTVTLPSDDADGLHAPGLRFGDRRVMALLAVIVGFAHLPAGFNNRQLTELVGTILDDATYHSRQATYDLRRLRRKGIIERIPHSHRYQLTAYGRRVAVLFTKAHGRVLATGLGWLDPGLPEHIAARSPLAKAWRQTRQDPRRVHRRCDDRSLKLDLTVNLAFGKWN